MSSLVQSDLHGNVQVLTLNNPSAFNAMDIELSKALLAAVRESVDDPRVRVVVITGSGKAFCAGGDLKAVLASEQGIAGTLCGIIDVLNALILTMRQSGKVFIAALNGVAAGAGMSLALACDLRIASERAKFRQAYSSSGLTPDAGWTVFAPAILGAQKAYELVLNDPLIDAESAKGMGLADEVVPAEELTGRALARAAEIAEKPMYALGLAKLQVNRDVLDKLEERLRQEYEMMAKSAAHRDAREGISAFVEKRSPVFNQ